MSTKFYAGALWIAVLAATLAGVAPQAAAQTDVETPQAVVTALYDEYLAYFAAVQGEPGFPPAGWYRDSALLSDAFVAALDNFLATWSMEKNYDPFLCAQDVPTAFSVDAPVLEQDGQSASAIVRTNFAGYHAFEVRLILEAGAWLIDEVVCGSVARDPAGVVKTFYLDYLAYNAGNGEGRRPNFVGDGMYRHTGLLSDSFSAALDALEESDARIADPLICAQDVPETIAVLETTIDGETAQVAVETSFAGHGFSVALEQIEGVWFISGITCRAN